ncbi:MAG: hypothetical protein K9K38_16880 [Rhodoferax sp.]|nr:hypothetical protein [Rhodoferax sp.]MCF8211055.1 hypothetical protein [Rhodoferax sp.]
MTLVAPAILIFMALATATTAPAQTVYRCGSTYSQTPCDQGVSLEVQDPRSALQKSQADAAIKKEKTIADAMENDRLQQEAAAQRSHRTNATRPDKKPAKELYTPPSVSSKSVEVSSRLEATAKAVTPKKKKTKEPEYFTAQSGPENKKKPPLKSQ